MSKGKSKVQFADNINVLVETLNKWQSKHIDFKRAMERAEQASLAFWETKLESYIEDKDINNPLVKLLFAYRFKYFDSRAHDASQIPEELPTVLIEVDSKHNGGEFIPSEEQKPQRSIH